MYAAILLLALSFTSARGQEDDWRPMGHGDPLRDPTHEYSPPQVQRVHYWLRAPSVALEPPPTRAVGLSQVAGWPQVTAHYLGYKNNFPATTPISITTVYPNIVPFQLIKSSHSAPFVEKNSIHGAMETLFVKPSEHDPPPPFFPAASSNRPITFSTSSPQNKPVTFPQQSASVAEQVTFTLAPPLTSVPSNLGATSSYISTDNFAAPTKEATTIEEPAFTGTSKYIGTTIIYDTTTTPSTTTTPTTSSLPLSFVIEGHSKVKKYGPLPESRSSIHKVNQNHLITNVIPKEEKNDMDKFNPFRLGD